MDTYIEVAAATVKALAPAEAIAEMVVQKGGEAAWKKAQAIWIRIKSRFDNDPVITSSATMVANLPNDEHIQTAFASILAERLQENHELTNALIVLLGKETIQKVTAENNSWIENVRQRIKGNLGSQIIHADKNSIIINVDQSIEDAG
jgi:hypothetical protein